MAKDTFLAKKQLMDVVQRSEDEREEMLGEFISSLKMRVLIITPIKKDE